MVSSNGKMHHKSIALTQLISKTIRESITVSTKVDSGNIELNISTEINHNSELLEINQ